MHIGFILFPNLTQLDLTGPTQVLHRMPGVTTHFLAKTMDPVPSDCGLALMPSGTFADTPDLDMICVPGGFGIVEAIEDPETLEFVRTAGQAADYVTSVCTGALVLGAAGLLKGKRATTHWGYVDLLEKCGAIYEEARVVRDGNTFTGGGVTAGIDFALTVVREVAGEDVAKTLQLALEYDPAPPFDAGHPSRAPERSVSYLKNEFYAGQIETLSHLLVR